MTKFCSDMVLKANQDLPLSRITSQNKNLIVGARWLHRDCFIPIHDADQHILCFHESGSNNIKKYERGKLVAEKSLHESVTFIPNDGTEWQVSGECRTLHMYLDTSYIFEVRDLIEKDFEIVPFFSMHDPWLEGFFKMLLAECHMYGNFFDSLLIDQIKNSVTKHLINHYSSISTLKTNVLEIENSKTSKNKLSIVVEYIQEYFRNTLSLKELANLACLSEFHFSRRFKDAFGVTPYQFVLQCRLKAAAEELIQSSEPIQVIAEKVGFSNSTSFSTSFKEWSGKSPRDYRQTFKMKSYYSAFSSNTMKK